MDDWIDSLTQTDGQLLILGALIFAFFVLAMLLLSVCLPIQDGEKPTLGRILAELRSAFFRGMREGIRGYFAPLRISPWRAAWRAARSPDASWGAPFKAWLGEIERITKGNTC